MEYRIERLNWKQFKKTVPGKTDTVILPVGTIEAHGPGALGTDAMIPVYLAERMAKPLNAMIAPAVNYGVTGSLLAYPGSLTVTPDTLKAFVREVLFSLADAGFKRIIVLNGHGGNNRSLEDMGAALWREKRAGCMVIHWWMAAEEVAAEYFDGTGHAGADELAALMAVDPSLVSVDDYKPNEAGHRFKGIEIHPFYRCIILNQPGKGYPKFDRSRSRKYMDSVVNKLIKDVKEVLTGWENII